MAYKFRPPGFNLSRGDNHFLCLSHGETTLAVIAIEGIRDRFGGPTPQWFFDLDNKFYEAGHALASYHLDSVNRERKRLGKPPVSFSTTEQDDWSRQTRNIDLADHRYSVRKRLAQLHAEGDEFGLQQMIDLAEADIARLIPADDIDDRSQMTTPPKLTDTELARRSIAAKPSEPGRPEPISTAPAPAAPGANPLRAGILRRIHDRLDQLPDDRLWSLFEQLDAA